MRRNRQRHRGLCDGLSFLLNALLVAGLVAATIGLAAKGGPTSTQPPVCVMTATTMCS